MAREDYESAKRRRLGPSPVRLGANVVGILFASLVASTAFGGCSSAPSSVRGAPKTPPDVQYRTGAEIGDDVLIWECVENAHVVMYRRTSAFCGASIWTLIRRRCGTTTGWDDVPETQRHDLPDEEGWR